MAGGTFDPLVPKVRPGTYINVSSTKVEKKSSAIRGVTVIPLINHNYGPTGQFIQLTNASPDAEMAKLGYSVYDAKLLLVKEAFKKASTVYVYIIAENTVKATGAGGGVTATAKYAGTRGNDFKYSIITNPVNGFDVNVYLGTALISNYEGISTVAELIAKQNPYLDFSATDSASELSAIASVSLTGGTDAVGTTLAYTKYLDEIETIPLNSFAFPVSGDDAGNLKAALEAKMDYLVNSCGKRIHAAVPDFDADNQFIINVTNGVILSDGTEIDSAKACAWVAAAYAGASATTSLTYTPYDDAVDVKGKKNHEEAVAAINNGEFFFSVSEEGEIVVEYDINSLVTLSDGVDSSYKKNRVQRTFDRLVSLLHTTFPPNKYDNDDEGWNVMDGVGASMLLDLEKEGSIKNVNTKTDFLVDRTASEGDHTYFDVFVQPVDSAEKLYFRVQTN